MTTLDVVPGMQVRLTRDQWPYALGGSHGTYLHAMGKDHAVRFPTCTLRLADGTFEPEDGIPTSGAPPTAYDRHYRERIVRRRAEIEQLANSFMAVYVDMARVAAALGVLGERGAEWE